MRLTFEKGLELATNYYNTYGNLLMKRDYKEGECALGRWVLYQRELNNKGKLTEKQKASLEAIGMVWEKENHGGGLSFEQKIAQYMPILKDYLERHNDLLVPESYSINNIRLGEFVQDLRSSNRNKGPYKGKLTKEMIKSLDELNMVWDIKDTQWDTMYLKLKSIFDKYGSIYINRLLNTDDKQLQKWVQHQKENYNNKSMSEDRVWKLEDLGINWGDNNEESWNECYQAAKNFFTKNDHLLIPYEFKLGQLNLGMWICRQRKKYEKNALSEEQISMLTEIGMVWDVNNANWDDNYDKAVSCYEDLGTIDIPADFVYDNFNLGRWLFNQRQLYRNECLSQDRIDRLELLDIDFGPQRVPQASIKEKTILYYISKLFNDAEASYKADWLKQKELDIFIPSINVAIEYDGQRWHIDTSKDEEKDKLCQDNGVMLIRIREPECPQYKGSSIKMIMSNISNEELEKQIMNSIALICQLKGIETEIPDININRDYMKIIGLLNDVSRNKNWDKMYELAKQYRKENGNLLIPRTYKDCSNIALGNWIYLQRQAVKANTKYVITQKQISLLNSIDMIWNVHEYRFNKTYSAVKENFDKYGDATYINNLWPKYNVNSWISALKWMYRNGKLSSERAKMLRQIGIDVTK